MLTTIFALDLLLLRRQERPWSAIPASGLLTVLAGTSLAARDVILSGWLLDPLSFVPLSLSWRAENPEALRIATPGYHRDPDNLWNVAGGWSWIPNWLNRLPAAWETYESGVLALAAAAAMILAGFQTSLHVKALGIIMLPSMAAVSFWWAFTPPSFLFAWGPLTTLLAIPLGWALWRLAQTFGPRRIPRRTVVGMAGPIIAVVVFSALTRLDVHDMDTPREWRVGVAIPYVVAQVQVAMTENFQTVSGLQVQTPIEGELCWSKFPLCTPQARSGLALRSEGLANGFIVN